jgi:hypothetical protein
MIASIFFIALRTSLRNRSGRGLAGDAVYTKNRARLKIARIDDLPTVFVRLEAPDTDCRLARRMPRDDELIPSKSRAGNAAGGERFADNSGIAHDSGTSIHSTRPASFSRV